MPKCRSPVGFTHLRLQRGIGRKSKGIAVTNRRKLGLGRDIAALVGVLKGCRVAGRCLDDPGLEMVSSRSRAILAV
jgi:hypothetical protein